MPLGSLRDNGTCTGSWDRAGEADGTSTVAAGFLASAGKMKAWEEPLGVSPLVVCCVTTYVVLMAENNNSLIISHDLWVGAQPHHSCVSCGLDYGHSVVFSRR